MNGPASLLVLKLTPLGFGITVVAAGILQATGAVDIDWGAIVEKVPEVAMVLIVVFYSLSMNDQNRTFIERLMERHAEAMARIATEVNKMNAALIQHDTRIREHAENADKGMARIEELIRDQERRRG